MVTGAVWLYENRRFAAFFMDLTAQLIESDMASDTGRHGGMIRHLESVARFDGYSAVKRGTKGV
jgi:hypothetical protein